jgi:ATP-dependent exoDNAse (exonuclease V) beta subunit
MPAQAPLRQQQILQKDTDGTTAGASEAAYAEWRRKREAVLNRASNCSISVNTITALARGEPGLAAPPTESAGTESDGAAAQLDVHIEFVARDAIERPTGRRFGALVHAVLAAIDLDPEREAISKFTELTGRMIGATPNEVAASIVAVSTALEHPILRRAARSAQDGLLRRETPVLLRRRDGSLAEGTVDLAFCEATSDGAQWTVLDFKTDREFAPAAAHYVHQVRLYSEAISASTGLACTGVLLVV